MMSSKFYKCCAVPQCTSTTTKTPEKLFIHVPRSEKRRKMWLRLALGDPTHVHKQSKMYFCEDHFDLPNDMQNYTEYKVMGSVKKVSMKIDCVPSKFDCQTGMKRANRSTEQPHVLDRITMVNQTCMNKSIQESNNSNQSSGEDFTVDSKTDMQPIAVKQEPEDYAVLYDDHVIKEEVEMVIGPSVLQIPHVSSTAGLEDIAVKLEPGADMALYDNHTIKEEIEMAIGHEVLLKPNIGFVEWKTIADQYNSRTAYCSRTAENLKAQWESTKKVARKEFAKNRKRMIRTGSKTKDALRKSRARKNETPDEKKRRLDAARERQQAVRASETDKQREVRLSKLRANTHSIRISESEEQTSQRLLSMREHARLARANETVEQTSQRLLYMREHARLARANKQISDHKRRKRSPNWLPSEKQLLLKLVEKHYSVIENKKTDGATQRTKLAEWKTIADQYNSRTTYFSRTAENLKAKWESTKKMARKEFAKNRKRMIRTGGGSPISSKKEDYFINRVIGLLTTSAVGLCSPYDTDSAAPITLLEENVATLKEQMPKPSNMDSISCFERWRL